MHQVKKQVLNQLRLVKTRTWSRLVKTTKKLVLSSPVWFFEVLGLWWTGLSLGPCPERQKPDWTGLPSTKLTYLKMHKNKLKMINFLNFGYIWVIPLN